MATGKESKREKLTSEDQSRMRRLYEEVNARLEEMSLITARNIGLDLSNGKNLKFAQSPASSAAKSFATIVIVCTETGCGCYDYETGECFVC
jgi:hypothetical protein